MTVSGLHITAAELRIMNVLWRLKSAAVRDVLNALNEEGGEPPAYTTVMTMMNQLAAKGALTVDKSRQPFVYQPAVARERVQRQRLWQLLETMFDGQAGELVMRLVEDSPLSPEDIRRIEQKIADREKAGSAVTPAARPRRRKS